MTDRDVHQHPRPVSAVELRARALEALLAERGLVSSEAINAVVELYERDVGPQNGARVIARAWVDEAYLAWLLGHATAAIAELGFGGELVFEEPWQGRALGMGVVALDRIGAPSTDFRTTSPRRSRPAARSPASRRRPRTTPPGSTRWRRCSPSAG